MEFALSFIWLTPIVSKISAYSGKCSERQAGILLAWSAFIHTVRQSKSIRSYFKSGTGLPAARVADRFLAEAA